MSPVRSFNMNVAPAGLTKVDTDGVTRIGNPGTTGNSVWIRVLLNPGTDTNAGDACNISFSGYAGGGANKLSIGNLGSTVTSAEGFWAIYHSTAAGNFGASTVPITAGQTVLLVAHITYGVGTNKDQVALYVNPPIANSAPTTADVTLTGISVGAFDKVSFTGFRICNGDELSLGTDWLSAVQPNSAGLLAFNSATYSQHEGDERHDAGDRHGQPHGR